MLDKPIVYRIEDNMDAKDYLCTTYQMRNFYRQLGDGFFSPLDIMNYIQHYKAAKMIKPNWRVLDVCCGRSMILPLIRYHASHIGEYIGVDISEKNIDEAKRKAAYNKDINHNEYYLFKHNWIISNVANMSESLNENYFDFIIYTSAIEHMQKEDGIKSLQECYKVMKKDAILFLSCPRTEGDGYDTQYKAHIYEWGLQELRDELKKIGFKIDKEIGLIANKRDIEKYLEGVPSIFKDFYNKVAEYLPSEFLTSVFAIPFPNIAKEVLILGRK